MKSKTKDLIALYVATPLALGLIIAYMSGYSLHPLNPDDWYVDGFPVGWRKVEATGIPPSPPLFTFFNPVGFVLDVLFWCGVVSAVMIVSTHVVQRSSIAQRTR